MSSNFFNVDIHYISDLPIHNESCCFRILAINSQYYKRKVPYILENDSNEVKSLFDRLNSITNIIDYLVQILGIRTSCTFEYPLNSLRLHAHIYNARRRIHHPDSFY